MDDRWFLPLLWAAAAAALLYAPFPTQRRYLLGVQTPLAMLAAFGWQRAVAPRFRPRARTLAAVAYITLAAVGLATELLPMLAKANPVASPYAYESPDAQAAYAWLATQGSPREQAVFASYEIGMRIPAITGMRVYAGHPFETANVEIKREDIRRFFDTATDDEWREALLRQNGIAFVWYQSAQAERGGWNPASADYLEAAFASPSVMIYRVRGE